MKASDLFVKALEQEGVEYVFGVPGEENLDFLNSIRDSKITFITVRHEQVGGFMAATYGHLTGKTGCCLATLGPGATNLTTAVAYAQLGRMPMLAITGQKAVKTDPEGRFQILNIVDMMRPLTKKAYTVSGGDNIPWIVRDAFRNAQQGCPGAVHIELPKDIAHEEASATIIKKDEYKNSIADESSINAVIDALHKAKHPLIIFGSDANRESISQTLLEFVDKTSIPFITTAMGKGVVDERHNLCLGTAAISDKDFIHRAISKSDLILCIGYDDCSYPSFIMKPETRVIHINFYEADISQVYFPQNEIIGDICNSINRLMEKIIPQSSWDFSFFLKTKNELEKNLQKGVDDKRFPVFPLRLVADIRKAMPSDGILTLDTGVYKMWFPRNYKAHRPRTVLLDNDLGTMSAGMPSAMAAKMVYPDRKVMAVCGDGGFMMNCQDLETAVRLGLDLVIVILHDDSYGLIRLKQKNMGFPDFALKFGNPDFVKFAESFGACGHKISATDELLPCLNKCLNTKGVHLVDVPVDYSENFKDLQDIISQANAF